MPKILRIIDTNILIAANGRDVPQATSKCIANCCQALSRIQRNGVIVVDDGWRIIGEYIQNIDFQKQVGVGDAFLKWILDNKDNLARCQQISITSRGSDPTHFKEFPSDPRLISFDREDRKFVAVSIAHPKRPHIQQVLDLKWKDFQKALSDCGITVEFLC